MVPSIRTETLNKLPIIRISHAKAEVTISLFGGHVLSYVPASDQRDRLWLSPNAVLDASKPIRGGVPICWPWFSDLHDGHPGSLPSHGFVRDQLWQLIDSREENGRTSAMLQPTSTKGPGFAHETELQLIVTVGDELEMVLQTTNKGSEPFTLTTALHSYFSVQDIHATLLEGVSGLYADKTRGFAEFDTPSPYTFTEETDRVHQCIPREVQIKTPSSLTQVFSAGHDSMVVWNPWQENSMKMADMSDDGYQQMLCVETAVTSGITLVPGQTHQLVQTIR